ncbi:hypothetical protein ABH923_002571 [Leifsonia sp. EB41]
MSRHERRREAAAEAQERAQAEAAIEATETDDTAVDADETLESEEEPG